MAARLRIDHPSSLSRAAGSTARPPPIAKMMEVSHSSRLPWRQCLAAAILALCLWPAAARAATPSAATLDAAQTGASTLTLEGFVVTGGAATSWYFAYAPASSSFCTSYGVSGTTSDTATQTATSDGPASADVAGLDAGTSYCYALMVSQGGSPVSGGLLTTTVGLPTTRTESAASTGASTATVSGEIDPSGQTTSYAVGYDTAGSVWCLSAGESGSPSQTSASQSLDASAVGSQDVSVDLTGLVPGDEYCAALIASNGSGTGTDATMEFLEGAPGAALLSATASGDTAATIEGQVDPAEQATSYAVEYDTAGSDWCASDGLDGTPDMTTAGTLAASDGVTDAEVDLVGLASGTQYCAELVAINNSASAASVMQTFTTTGTATATAPITTAPTTTTTKTTTAPTKTTTTTVKRPTHAAPKKPAPAAPKKPTTMTKPAATTPVRTTTSPSNSTHPPSTTPPAHTSSVGRPSVYAIAVGRSRAARAVKVRVPKAWVLRLRITSNRSRRARVTVTVSTAAGKHARRIRVVRIALRPHTTHTISVRIPRRLRRALGGRRTVRVTTAAR